MAKKGAVIFPASKTSLNDLAAAIDRLLSDPALYARLSLGSEVAWQRLQLPVTMGKLLEVWLSDDPGPGRGLASVMSLDVREKYDESVLREEQAKALRR